MARVDQAVDGIYRICTTFQRRRVAESNRALDSGHMMRATDAEGG
jgi:hypothetical protein